MTDVTCAQCGAATSPHDVVSVASPDGTFRLLCSRCFNTEMARLADVDAFEHPEFTPVRLPDADGVAHEFHFRSLLFGDRLSLEAFELACGDEDCGGFRFQLLGDPRTDPFALLGHLVQKCWELNCHSLLCSPPRPIKHFCYSAITDVGPGRVLC